MGPEACGKLRTDALLVNRILQDPGMEEFYLPMHSSVTLILGLILSLTGEFVAVCFLEVIIRANASK